MTGIPYACDQRTPAWYAARCGVITASNAHVLVTKTGKVSTSQGRDTYLNGLIAERITRCVEVPEWTSRDIERGIELEPRAREWYSRTTGRQVSEVGFVYRDGRRHAGCSPDGIVTGDGRGVEIKCRKLLNHVAVLLHNQPFGDDAVQCQFSMWVTGLPVWDYVSYTTDPTLPSVVIPVERDEAMMASFDIAVPLAQEYIEDGIRKLAPHLAGQWPPKAGEVTVVMPMTDDVDMEGMEL